MKLTLAALAAILILPGISPALVLDYSTYLGGSDDDTAYALALDSLGCMYLAGDTLSTDFPTANAFQASADTEPIYTDAFVTKVASDGSALIFSTYLGGNADDGAQGAPDYKMGIAVDSDDAVYVAGKTASTDFPTLDPFQAANPGSVSVFLTKFASDGSSLLYSTYLGGSDNDYASDVVVDAAGAMYLTGRTGSRDFPTQNPFQAGHGGGNDDVFVAKLEANGSASLVYSTYLGGSGHDDRGYGIAVDDQNRAYVAGSCDSEDFPTRNAYDPKLDGYSDAFLTKFDSAGSDLIFSTFLGGASYDDAADIVVDGDYFPYLTGSTTSSDFPTVKAFQAARGGSSDVFVTKFASDGSSLVFSTYIGGGDFDNGRSIGLDAGRFVYVGGETASDDYPLQHPYQDELNQGQSATAYDAFVTKLCCMGNFLIYSSYLGGAEDDYAYALAVDANECAYLAGATDSNNFPVSRPFQAALAGGVDAFLAKLGHTPPLLVLQSGDYNGDGHADMAVFRDRTALWAVRGVTVTFYGRSGDTPVSGDYDGDGTTDIAVYRGSTGLWAVRNLTRTYYISGGDTPVPEDYDGDGTTDIAVFRGSVGLWAVRGLTKCYYGGSKDIPVPGNYASTPAAEFAVYRGGSSLWAIRGVSWIYFGRRTDKVVPADYNGDGIVSPAVFSPISGQWKVRGLTRVYWGGCADMPAPADYSGNGTDDIGLFRSYLGLWAVRGVTRGYFGASGDIPVTR